MYIKNLKNKSGISLVEVMIATGLVSILGLAISNTLTTGFKAQKGLQAKDQQREFTATIRDTLLSDKACKNTFAGVSFSGTQTINSIKDATNAIVFQKDTKDKSKLLKISRMTLEDFTPTAGTPGAGTAVFRPYFSKVDTNTGTANELAPDVITIKAQIASGLITDCVALGQSSDLWQRSATNLSNIYYNGGNVGVGTISPSYKLEVQGGQFVVRDNGTATVPAIGIADNNTGIFRIGAGEGIGFTINGAERMRLDAAGKLDVVGGVRPGSSGILTGGTCSPEGTLGYDQSAHAPVFCNSSGKWASMSAGAPLVFYSATAPAGTATKLTATAPCSKPNISIEYGGRWLFKGGKDPYGEMVLRINGSDISKRFLGNQVSGADARQVSHVAHGLWKGTCTSTMSLQLFYSDNNPGRSDFQEPFIKVTFLD